MQPTHVPLFYRWSLDNYWDRQLKHILWHLPHMFHILLSVCVFFSFKFLNKIMFKLNWAPGIVKGILAVECRKFSNPVMEQFSHHLTQLLKTWTRFFYLQQSISFILSPQAYLMTREDPPFYCYRSELMSDCPHWDDTHSLSGNSALAFTSKRWWYSTLWEIWNERGGGQLAEWESKQFSPDWKSKFHYSWQ